MHWIQVAFDQPTYLWGLLLLPLMWMIGRRSLVSLGRERYWLAMGVRSAVVVLLACALAEIQLVRISERVVALFLLDQSTSIDRDQQQAAFHYANAAWHQHRSESAGDMSGVIVFGGEAQVEHPPNQIGYLAQGRQTLLDQSRTNIAAALRLAKASFPEGAARRVVVLSDGNQNVGDALVHARELTSDGIARSSRSSQSKRKILIRAGC